MKHPLGKLGKKNRNIISGILVGLASLFLIVFYLEIETSVLLDFLVAVLLFIFGIIVLSVCFLLVIKGLRHLFFRDKGRDSDNTDVNDKSNDAE